MKIRIKDNSIRLRLDKRDIDQLSKNGHVTSRTMIPGDGCIDKFIYALKEGGSEISALLANNTITISIPKDRVTKWTQSEEVGIEHTLDLKNGDRLRLLIEKDFQCLMDRPHENEDHMFPNPLVKTNQSH